MPEVGARVPQAGFASRARDGISMRDLAYGVGHVAYHASGMGIAGDDLG